MPPISQKPKTKTAAIKTFTYSWEAVDKTGKKIKGELLAPGENAVSHHLRKQGLTPVKVTKLLFSKRPQKITDKDLTMFTRQMATMMKSGVPLLQSFDIVGKGHANPSMGKLISDIKADIETGASLSAAFAKHPLYFDTLFCNLVAAGETAGILDQLLDRLAVYKEKTLLIKSKIKKALMYPSAILVVAFLVTALIMIFVVPSFKELFSSFGAELPTPTKIVMAMSDFFVQWWYVISGGASTAIFLAVRAYKQSIKAQRAMDRFILKAPVIGPIITKATIARWTRTLSTMFAAGVPLVEALDSVAGASGNYVYYSATKKIQNDVSTGSSLTNSMQGAELFPSMVIQMTSIGEESGSLDSMLGKVADFFEQEVDDAVDGLSSLMEPIIMAFLGIVVGGLVVAMYLPVFKMGDVVK